MSRSGRLWPWALGAVLTATIAGNLWVMRLAAADPSFAVEPEYYSKAVSWDSTMAQGARNTALGWRLDAVLGLPADGGAADLRVTLLGIDGLPIEDATIAVEATHNARASQVRAAVLIPSGNGRYAARLAGGRPGIWELRFVVTRGSDRFTATQRHDTSRHVPAR